LSISGQGRKGVMFSSLSNIIMESLVVEGYIRIVEYPMCCSEPLSTDVVTVYRPGEVCQMLWFADAGDPEAGSSSAT